MDYIEIGKITTTHGIKGEVKFLPTNSDIFAFDEVKYLYLGEKKEKLSIEKARPHKNIIIIKFKEYSNINEVITFRDKKLYISKEDRKDLKENEYFINDLIGLKVYNLDDIYIGELAEVMQGIGNDVYIINKDSKEFLIPAVKEFIKLIDIDNKKMIIDPIDGMIE